MCGRPTGRARSSDSNYLGMSSWRSAHGQASRETNRSPTLWATPRPERAPVLPRSMRQQALSPAKDGESRGRKRPGGQFQETEHPLIRHRRSRPSQEEPPGQRALQHGHKARNAFKGGHKPYDKIRASTRDSPDGQGTCSIKSRACNIKS